VWFNIGLIVVAVLSVMFYIVNPFSDTNNLLLIISMFSMSIFVWLIGIWGNAQKNIILPVLYEDNNYKTIENGELQIIYDNLVETINQSKIFTKPYLTLSELASNIGTNRTYISQAINLQGHMNFNAFINKFRINEAISILNKNPKIKIEELALMSGFGSVISFQRAFNKDIGKTLTEWKNRKE
ncbi:MAG: helix-turn-helix transcriptional regulator, partial [Bacteroidales bacterium]|jgi:YesN/AraC family two-component response regulator|nr:helix-turn-helix transcriptional regulator [Bacteroidales bacterium]